jgi:thiol:disulfide interchange protein
MASRVLAAFAFSLGVAAWTGAQAGDESLTWESWSPQLFDRARAEQRLVILDLEAVWCHWCHVMERTTYRDAKGWPATNKICSQPVFDPADLAGTVSRMLAATRMDGESMAQ